MPNFGHLLRRWSRPRRNAWRPPSRRRPGLQATSRARVWALVIVSSVVKVFDETMNSVSAGSRSRVASAKSVPSTFETKRNVIVAVAVVPQRLVGHHRPEVGAADADVDDVADALAGVALPCRRCARGSANSAILSSTACTCGHDVLAVDDDRRVLRRAQRHVQHRAVLGDVDLLAAEHRVDPLAQARLLGQLQQQLQRLVGDAVLRVVEIDARGLERQALAARRVVGEQSAQMQRLHFAMVRLERLPGGPRGQG